MVIRFISGQEVPGLVSQCIRKSRSLNDGSRDCPSSGQIARPATAMTPTVMYAGRGVRMIRESIAS